MNLKLALVRSCGESGCSVAPLDSDSTLEITFSRLVRDRIRIQPGHLVAFNTDKNPPEIVWRWIRTVVIELKSDSVMVDDMMGHPAQVSTVDELPLDLAEGDQVWACGTGSGFEIHDIILDGKPNEPNRLLTYITPIIEETYSK